MSDTILDLDSLADIREVAAQTLVDTCDVYDAANPRASVHAGLSCRVTSASVVGNPYFSGAGDRPESEGVWIIRLPVGTDVQPDWQVRMAADTRTAGLRGRVFTISGDAAGSDEITRRVLAVEGQ